MISMHQAKSESTDGKGTKRHSIFVRVRRCRWVIFEIFQTGGLDTEDPAAFQFRAGQTAGIDESDLGLEVEAIFDF